MWILPSRGRPHLVERSLSECPPTAPGIVAIDDDQVQMYADVKLPGNWSKLVLPRMYLSQKLNSCFAELPFEEWYGVICDDQTPMTEGWDTELPKTAGAWGISWGDEQLNGRIGAAVYGGELIRTIGWLCCPALKHFYTDDVSEMIASELGIGRPRMDIKIPHLHFSTGKTPHDQTYQERPSGADDKIAFEKWKTHEWPGIRSRLQSLIS